MAPGRDGNLYALLEGRFPADAGAPAFTRPQGGGLSYGALRAEVGRYANALATLGVKPGDRVTVQVDKSLANVCLYLATLKAGAVFNPLNPAYTPAEVAYFVADAEPALLVVSPDREGSLGPLAQAHGVAHVHTLDEHGGGSLAELAAGQSGAHETARRAGDDLACLVYTSGTTGRSKGAMLCHGNLVSNALTLHALWGFVAGDVLLHALPVFHVHGLQVALHTALLNGSEILWLDRFHADEVIGLLPRASVYMGVPTHYTRLLARTGLGREACANMRLFISGSAPLPAELHEAFARRTGHRILERYGMTETGMIASNPCDGERIAGTVGYALPGVELRIADKAGRPLPAGEVGAVEVKGLNVFKGYWRLPEKTAEEFRPGRWFVTGDMGRLAPDGRLTLVGRAKDLIISGGLNVYPGEVEAALNAFEGIGESAVVGVPHPDFGEGVVAVVIGNEQAAMPPECDIVARLRRELAAFKLPKRVFEVAELPRNAMGKVQKAALRERFAGTFRED